VPELATDIIGGQPQGVINASGTVMNATITTKVGTRIIELDAARLVEILNQLRSERERHQREIENRIGEAGQDALLAHAERIKNTAIKIGEAESGA
jgi:hypothetical protein